MPDVTILGINEVGHEESNGTITDGRDLPWLQDTPEADVWGTWPIEYRDVIVLDGENEHVGTINLTARDLGEEAAREDLRSLLEQARP